MIFNDLKIYPSKISHLKLINFITKKEKTTITKWLINTRLINNLFRKKIQITVDNAQETTLSEAKKLYR
jgi:hypothetical protein